MSLTNSSTTPSKYLWRTHLRTDAPRRSITERIRDFLEVYGCIDESTARQEATRCLQCPDAPCVEGCPIGNQIPRWMVLVEEGRFAEATAILAGTGCMPEVVSRLCRQTCEDYCVLEKTGAPVAVNSIERFLNHYAQQHNLTNISREGTNGWRVAVVGSGPAGLACTVELVTAGYNVRVFEIQPTLGGFLVQGMPAFRMDQSFIQRRIQELKDAGVLFQSGCVWGKDISLAKLRSTYDAVLLGPCLEGTKPLEIPGANLSGVYQALDFILQMNFPWTAKLEGLEVKGKKVIVLGGGDTAVDALRSAIRAGAREAVCLYRREQNHMPADPKQCEEAAVEGAHFFFNVLPVEVVGDVQKVIRIRCIRTESTPGRIAGKAGIKTISGSEFQVEADIVLSAYGFRKPSLLAEAEIRELRMNEFGGVAVDEKQMTSEPGVFAAGVLVTSSLGLTEAVRDARKAARGIASYLAAKVRTGERSC